MALDTTTVSIILVGLLYVSKIVYAQGGPKVVWWRIRGKRGFLLTMAEPDKRATRKVLPMSIVHNSIPRFTYEGGDYFTGGPDETIYAFGMPNWVYERGDSRPLLLRHHGEIMSASKIHAAFYDDSIERFNALKQPTPGRFKWGLFGFAIALILLLAIANVAYTYLFGVNVNCALHTRACP